ncbi:nuclear pore complex protein NUP35-like [Zingiber officinale]|uniref:Nuclear pore complex protein NUP35 n=1 Tax=Zingiber officinale TaxID=94328 RepID=A0A8J5H7W3_ZINOF|nr:nuclear pore complex protein NUP35-like [Zingiber officinale]KAG6511200.1 hypothetical protein ZIOFF_029255 [Zingiber officinale]
MSSPVPRSSTKPTRLSPFFRDLASPISPHRRSAGQFSAPRHGAAVDSDLPPPPFFTLDDRADFSPEADLPPPSLVSPIGARSWGQKGSLSPSPSYSSSSRFLPTRAAEANGAGPSDRRGKSPEGSSWAISPAENGGERDPDRSSPVDGVVEPGALIVLPPPPSRDLPRPELQGPVVLNGGLEADTWVTVFGFSPADTNLVLREFEKCGPILKHVPGPRNSNWIHILYQKPYHAQIALKKNGTQLNNLLVVGVKPVDPMHRHHLKESAHQINQGGFMVSLPSKVGTLSRSSNHADKSSNYSSDQRHHHSNGIIATPANSLVSKVMDLVFGM